MEDEGRDHFQRGRQVPQRGWERWKEGGQRLRRKHDSSWPGVEHVSELRDIKEDPVSTEHTLVPHNCSRVIEKNSLGPKLIACIFKKGFPEPEVLLCSHSVKLLSWGFRTCDQQCVVYILLQRSRCPAKAVPSFELAGKRNWISPFLNDLPFGILGSPWNGRVEDNIKGKPSFVFPLDFSAVSFDCFIISKKNSPKVSSLVCFCWNSWPFLSFYKFNFGAGGVKQPWATSKWPVSPVLHTIWGGEGVIPAESVLAVNWPF